MHHFSKKFINFSVTTEMQLKYLMRLKSSQYLINVGEIGSKRSYSLNHLLVARNLRHYTCIWCCTDTVYTVVYICFD